MNVDMVSKPINNNSSVVDSPKWRNFMHVTVESLPDIIKNFSGGRLGSHLNKWRDLTNDYRVIDTVKGLKIEFIDFPSQAFIPKEYSHTDSELQFLHGEIDKLLAKQVIEKVEPTQGQFVSNIFLRDKKDGSYRMILNLTYLNYSVEYFHFKMDTLKTAINLMTPGCYMASIDFKDAYYSVPIYKPHRKFLRFRFQNQLYEFTCLPNGLSSGPRLFTKVTKPLFASLRQKGFINTVYIDDSLLYGDTFEECCDNVIETTHLSMELGFVVHYIKSIFQPTQIIEFLGFILNSQNMTVRLTEEKALTLKRLCIELLSYKKPKIRTVARVLGKMVASFPGVTYGPLYYRRFDNQKTQALKENMGNYEKPMKLSPQSREDIAWWIGNITSAFKLINPGQPQHVVFSDASRSGWGEVYGEIKTGGHWSSAEDELHINVLELLAAFYISSSLCHNLKDTHIRMMIDNQTAIAYINNMGGRKTTCNNITRRIWEWCIERNIWLTAAYVTSKDNFVADEQSRIDHNNSEWELNNDIFKNIIDIWGSPEIDLFATRLNHKLDRYISWKPDPFSEGVDAFNVYWGDKFSYIFPPLL